MFKAIWLRSHWLFNYRLFDSPFTKEGKTGCWAKVSREIQEGWQLTPVQVEALSLRVRERHCKIDPPSWCMFNNDYPPLPLLPKSMSRSTGSQFMISSSCRIQSPMVVDPCSLSTGMSLTDWFGERMCIVSNPKDHRRCWSGGRLLAGLSNFHYLSSVLSCAIIHCNRLWAYILPSDPDIRHTTSSK